MEYNSTQKTEYDDGRCQEFNTTTMGENTRTTITLHTPNRTETNEVVINNETGEEISWKWTTTIKTKDGTVEYVFYDKTGKEVHSIKYYDKDGKEIPPPEATPEETSNAAQTASVPVNLDGWTDNGDGTYSYKDEEYNNYEIEIEGDKVTVYQNNGNWTIYENGVPTTVRFSSDGFNRKVEIDPNTGKMYTTHGGTRLEMFEINEQGAAVRVPSLYIDGHNYYIVSNNGNSIYSVEDLNGNTYTCKKYPNGHVEFVK